jgi:transposase
MIQIGSRTKIFVNIEPVDFRSRFRGLSAITRNIIGQDPLSGHIFIFRNTRNNAVKMICFDGYLCWTFHASFARGKLSWWPSDGQIQTAQLMGLLAQSSEVVTSSPFRDVS